MICLVVLLALGCVIGIMLSMGFQAPPPTKPPPRPHRVEHRPAPVAANLTCCGALSPWRCSGIGRNTEIPVGGSARFRIGFVTTATGAASAHVPKLWRSLQLHAFPGHEVHLHVFTDVVADFVSVRHELMHVREYYAKEPPFDALGRFGLYVDNLEWLGYLDYVFAIDVNTLVVAQLDVSILGERVATLSAWNVHIPRKGVQYDSRLTYDLNPFSSAYVAGWEGGCYFAGELFGGTLYGFEQILKHALQLVRSDLEDHPPRAATLLDESYLNRVFIDLVPSVVLTHNYMLPEAYLSQLGTSRTAAGGFDLSPRIVKFGKRAEAAGAYEPRVLPIPDEFLRLPGVRSLQLPFTEFHQTVGLTFVVRAFERGQCLQALLRSLSERYPGADVTVLDDSKNALLTPDDLSSMQYWSSIQLTYVRAEYNIGLSEARNRLLRLVETPYVVFLTDKMVMDHATDVQHLVGVLEANGADIVGGCVIGAAYGAHRFTFYGGVMHQTVEVMCTHSLDSLSEDYSRTPEFSTPSISCWEVHLPLEFFVARVSALRKLEWDTRIGRRSHEDLFLQAMAAGVRVSMCHGVAVQLNPVCSCSDSLSDYGPVDDEQDEWVNLMTKWKFTEIRLPTATIKLTCRDGVLKIFGPCVSTTSGPVVQSVIPPGVPATDAVCCGDDSPWVCATGGRPAGNVDTWTRVSRYRRLKIGFVTYATGPYNAFVRDLWVSIQEHAFTRHDVHLFVFTDDTESYDGQKNVHTLLQKRVGWPFDSLGRHFLFLEHIDWFSSVDYIFSVDSDAVVVGTLDETMLGERVACLNAWYFGLQRDEYTYETRLTPAGTPLSKGYIGASEGQCYFAGGMFGGTVRGFREILEGTVRLARSDLNACPPRVALWHDESYLNRVFLDVPPTVVLAPNYMYPEAPVDAWLYVQPAPSAVRAWYMPQDPSRRFSPRILNLGVRKHVDRNAAVYQPLSAEIPAFMTSSGVPGTMPMPLVRGQRLDELTFIVKAFERPDCLRRLLKSIGDVYPGANVIVLDDSKAALLPGDEASVLAIRHNLNFTYLRTEYDIGLSAGRNRLVDVVKTSYAVLLDDDSVLNGSENILLLVTVLEAGRFDIAGGCVQSPKYGPGWSYSLSHGDNRLTVAPDVACTPGELAHRPPDFNTADVACWKVDFILNFFVGRVEALRSGVQWDPRLKLGEHEDFFLRAQKRGLKVAMCRGITVLNDHSCDTSTVYASSRARVYSYWKVFFETWGLHEMHTAAGVYRLQCEGAANGAGRGVDGRPCEVKQVSSSTNR